MTLPFPDFVNVSPEAQDDECRRTPAYKRRGCAYYDTASLL